MALQAITAALAATLTLLPITHGYLKDNTSISWISGTNASLTRIRGL